MNKEKLIKLLHTTEIKNILTNIGIKHLYIVGSYSRGDYTYNSDIDFVYEKDKTIRIGGLKFIKYKNLLEEKLNKKIDLVDIDFINKHYKNSIEKDKKIIF